MAVFVLTVIFSVSISQRVYGDSVVGTVETKVSLKIDGKNRTFTTTQNTIEGALAQNDIRLVKNDITEPPLDTYLSGKALNVQLVRAVPVLISDNNQSWGATSAYTQPADILKQLNVEIFPEDKVSAELIMDPAAEGAVGQKVLIERAPVYTIYVDDTTKVVRSWKKTVGEMLTEKGIVLGVNDIVEPPKTSALVGVSEITVTRINYADIVETTSVEFQTLTQKSYDMYKGQTNVLQVGVNGSKKESLHIVYHNGIEVSRNVTSSVIIETPQNKIVQTGVKPYNAGMWWDTLVVAGSRWGVDPAAMFRVMACESGGTPDNSNGTNTGLFQYAAGTWSGASRDYPGGVYRGAEITDGVAQIYVTAWKVSEQRVPWTGWGCKP